ncbi:MAG: MASE1 domain-containing protein [Cyanobacteria bacterium P01_E01_bin.6]
MPHVNSRWMPYFFSVSAIAVAYWAVGNNILAIPELSGSGSPVWPSAGIAMAGLVIFGCSRWPGVFLGSFLLDYTHGAVLLHVFGGAIGASLQAVLGTILLKKLMVHRELDRLRDALQFIGVAVLLASLVNATISVTTLGFTHQLDGMSPWTTWATFYLGDGMGILMVTPVLMLLSQVRNSEYGIRLSSQGLIEMLIWLLALVLSSWFVFHQPLPSQLGQYPIEYLPVPLLIWATLRFGQLPAVVGSVIISAIAISGAVQEIGLFVDRAGLVNQSPIWLLQTFMAVIGTTTLILSTTVREQRLTRSLLTKRDASFRTAQQIAKLGHWEYDVITQHWTSSDELLQLLGVRRDENALMSGRDAALAGICEADWERVDRLYQLALQTGEPYMTQYRVMRPDGEIRHVIEQVEVREHCVIGVLQDVTERVRAERALRESEEKFSKAFGFSPDAMTISTLDEGRILDVNESFLKLSGYQHHEVINRTVAELNLWSSLDDRQWLTDQLRQHQSVRNQEFEFRRQSGDSAFALVSAEIITIQSHPYLLIVARDITEQKRSDEQLRLAVERDRLLGTLALHIRQTLDLEKILETTVHEVRQLLKTTRVFISRFDSVGHGSVVAESVHPDFPSLMGEHMDEGVYQDVCRVFNHMPIVAIDDMEEIDQFPCLFFLKECVQRYQVKASLGVPILVNDSLYGILVAHSCETTRHWTSFEKELLEQLATQVAIAIQQGELYAQVQQLNTGLEHQVCERTWQLEEKMQELQELNQLRDVFLHAVSHDLLTTARGYLLVLRPLQIQTQDPIHLKRDCLERMIQASEHLLNKLNAIQEAYTFKTQGIYLQREQVQLSTLIQEAIADLTPLIEHNRATLTVECSSEMAKISADKPMLMRVFNHLIHNAVIHNPPGVNLHIRLYPTQQQAICIIADDGVGIPEKTRDRLFHLCSGTPDSPQLTGISLGLYFCDHVIRAHGGHIDVSSDPDNGTAVTIALPLFSEQHVPLPFLVLRQKYVEGLLSKGLEQRE